MNILICDDVKSEAAELAGLLQASGFPVNINQFYHALDARNFIRTGAEVDCCFLDIIMPEMDGIVLAEKLRQEDYVGRIVFLSTSKDYGPETYTVDAFSYLLKPLTAESVKVILEKLDQAIIKDDRAEIAVQIAGSTKILLLRNISYAEVILHKVYFHMTDGAEVCITATFSEIAAQLLRDPRFIRCHRSYVVNMQDIAEVSEREMVIHSGRRIPVSRSYRDTRTKFYQWKFGGE